MASKYISSETIEKIADQIRSDFLPTYNEDGFSEVDIYRIASELGCKIEIVDFKPEAVSARVLRSEPSSEYKYIIQVARNDGPRRQKFSIAHEIAHIILHDEKGGEEFIELRQPIVDYSSEELYKETQANMLASALLLPQGQLTKIWISSRGIDEIADVLNVSREAVCNRLINLGLLRNE